MTRQITAKKKVAQIRRSMQKVLESLIFVDFFLLNTKVRNSVTVNATAVSIGNISLRAKLIISEGTYFAVVGIPAFTMMPVTEMANRIVENIKR